MATYKRKKVNKNKIIDKSTELNSDTIKLAILEEYRYNKKFS